MDAIVTVEFLIKNVCSEDELSDKKTTLESVVRWLVTQEGLLTLAEDDPKIVSIRQAHDTTPNDNPI